MNPKKSSDCYDKNLSVSLLFLLLLDTRIYTRIPIQSICGDRHRIDLPRCTFFYTHVLRPVYSWASDRFPLHTLALVIWGENGLVCSRVFCYCCSAHDEKDEFAGSLGCACARCFDGWFFKVFALYIGARSSGLTAMLRKLGVKKNKLFHPQLNLVIDFGFVCLVSGEKWKIPRYWLRIFDKESRLLNIFHRNR